MVSFSSLCIHWQWKAPLNKVQPFVVIFSCFVLNVVFGSYTTFGNLLPYIVSYIRERSSPSDINLTYATYVFAAQLTGLGCTMILGGVLDRFAGPRIVVLLSGALTCLGVVLSYFTIQYSFWLFLLSYGILYGIGNGLSSMSIISCAVTWMPRWKGLVSGFVISGMGVSPFLFNALQTAFINPSNKPPNDLYILHDNYFTQPEILDRVPVLFLLLALVYISIIGIASIFIALPYPANQVDSTKENKMESFSHDSDGEDDKKQGITITPLEMLKQVKFYHLCLMFILGVTVHSFVLSLYKSFGFQEITTDDHFLTIAGSSSAVFNFIGHIVWGLLTDVTGYTFALVLHSSYVAITLFTLYITTAVSKIMFFVWLCVVFFGIGGYFSIFPVATAENFGQKYLATNYGIILGIAEISGSLLASFISHMLIDYIYWFGIFFLLGGTSVMGLFLALLLHIYKIRD